MAIPPIGPLGATPLPGNPSRGSPGQETMKRRRDSRRSRSAAQALPAADEVTVSAEARRRLAADVEDREEDVEETNGR